SKGIRCLIEAEKELGDVVVVAPDKPQSGMGHAVTISGILRLNKVELMPGVSAYSCNGTPVDCVKLAIYRVLDRRPDLLVSGINHGANSSINVIYSGTMSAAVEGALENISSIGFSLLEFSADADFRASASVAKKIAQQVLSEGGLPEGICLNVNVPKGAPEEIKGIRICRQAKACWDNTFDQRADPSGKNYFWLTGEFKNFDKGEDTDEFALRHNFVSVVPVQYDLTAYHAFSHLQQWEL
ncbi:MAG: 5'/3'-nucleotidase SurE, partial [Crocinitomicaceae bacterium]|nr:5'/3'-nucleotidase SurE [Crocinitomicaceae bacterium]